MRKNLLKSGEFAQHSGVTKKALRVYMEKGLLVPDYVDMETGYRYYSVDKVAQVEEIVKMRQIGLSLDQIKAIFDDREPLEYLETLYSLRDDVDAQLKEASEKRLAIQHLIENQMMFLNPCALRHCHVEYQPARLCVRYPIEPYDAETDTGTHWLKALDVVKRDFSEKHIPLLHFKNVGGTLDLDALKQGRLIYDSAILLPESVDAFPDAEIIPAGYSVTMYDERFMSNTAAIGESVRMLVDFAEKRGFGFRGPYMQTILAETTMYDFKRLLYVVKEELPIWLDGEEPG